MSKLPQTADAVAAAAGNNSSRSAGVTSMTAAHWDAASDGQAFFPATLGARKEEYF